MKQEIFILLIICLIQIVKIEALDEASNLRDIDDEIKFLKGLREKKEFTNFLTKAHQHFNKSDILQAYQKTKSNSNSKCVDPNEEEMMINLVRLTLTFKELSGVLDLETVREIYKKVIVSDSPDTKYLILYGDTRCIEQINSTKINEISVCPWHTTVDLRRNRYPSMVSHAVCSCDKCLGLNSNKVDKQFKCKPVYKLTPALIRDEQCNSITGVYDWKPIIEKIAVSCVCADERSIVTASSDPFY
jgi:hypothetical protein